MLYITSHDLFFNWKFVPFNPLYPSTRTHPSSLTTIKLLSVSMRQTFLFCFFFLDFSCKWDHMIFVFPCLTYFTKHNVLECYPCCHNGQLSFFLMPRILTLYAYILHISHILIYSFTDGHLCCFCILAIENNAAMNIGSIYLFELVFCLL